MQANLVVTPLLTPITLGAIALACLAVLVPPLVPYVETAEQLFLKTIIPSRKAHRSFTDQRINIRLSSGDLQAIRSRALQEGVPYQTLISSVLHKYVSGTLQEQPTIQAAR